MTLDEFLAMVDNKLPDNDQGLITAADVRALFALLVQRIKEGVDA